MRIDWLITLIALVAFAAVLIMPGPAPIKIILAFAILLIGRMARAAYTRPRR